MTYDVITVGGGLAGSSLALALTRKGYRVLVLEREKKFRDRVRGEGMLPWGVNEARKLGIFEDLESCGRPIRYWTSHGWRKPRDLHATTPGGVGCLNFYHPEMQEAMLGAAETAGAEVRRGVSVKAVTPGASPEVLVSASGSEETLRTRLVAAADGRGSRVREGVGFEPKRDSDRLVIAGLLLEGSTVPDTSEHIFRDSPRGEGALFFPLGEGRVRSYFIYWKQGERRGLTGEAQVDRFLDCCRGIDVPSEWLTGASAAGPLAEFDGADTWIEHPYKDGVALVGDAASCNDPAWGNGLSLTVCDVRALTDALLANDDWDRAGHVYGEAHDRHFGAIRRVTRWLTEMMYEVGPDGDARRERAYPFLGKDKSRSLDYIALGPETPSDEEARKRFFCEDQP